MRMLTSFRILRVTLAFAVALWMAGAGCLLGCENNVASAANEVRDESKASTLVVSGDACASAHSRSCCSSHGAKAKRSAKAKQSLRPEHPNSVNAQTRQTASSNNSPTLAPDSSSSSMMNCPLAVNSAAALSKSGPDNVEASWQSQTPANLSLTVIEHQLLLFVLLDYQIADTPTSVVVFS